MGLKNISTKAEMVKYNGISKIVEPGDSIDVRDFNINNNEVAGVEHILSDKHRTGDGKKIFEQVKTLSNMTDAQINAEIARLKQELEDSTQTRLLQEKEIETLNQSLLVNQDQSEKIKALEEEIEALQKKIKKLEK